jgi:hypothetical protein
MIDFDSAPVRASRTISRRRLLQGAIAGAIALSASGRRTAWAGRSPEAIINSVALQSVTTCTRNPDVFDAHQFDTLVAIGAQIIPSVDEHGAPEPGASEACTIGFIELNAAGNDGLKGLLTGGVAALDGFTQSHPGYGADFVDLSFEDQTEVLQTIANLPSQDFLNIFFSTCRSLHKTAWLINWPEAFVRGQDGQPIVDDLLISDPDVPGTGTGWEVIKYHVIDWQVEQLLWAWQAGLKVTGFANGWPTFSAMPLTTKQRLAARDQLYALSDQGLA